MTPTIDAKRAFDAFVRSQGLGKGVLDLNNLAPLLRDTLGAIRAGYHDALANERANDPNRPTGLTYYVDFVDSDELGAWAFWIDGVSFVGVTFGLVNACMEHAFSLRESPAVLKELGLDDSQAESLAPVLFHVVLAFVMSHEYAHHFWKHVGPASLHRLDEYGKRVERGMASQAREAVADGYAVYLVLENQVRGDMRAVFVEKLRIRAMSEAQQTKVLVSVLVTAVAAFFAIRFTGPFDPNQVRELSHPPPVTRLAFLMEHIRLWARDVATDSELMDWVNGDNYRRFMFASVGMVNAADLSAESAFRKTADGLSYVKELKDRINEEKLRS